MGNIIYAIRETLGISQEEMAGLLGISFATVNRWENGRSKPNKMAQLRLYDLCREKGVELEGIVRNRISQVVSGLMEAEEAETAEGNKKKQDIKILFHGSKSGIKGDIAPISRTHCDFGKGFYMGSDPCQPLTLISDFEKSKLYVVSLDMSGLRVLHVQPDMEWAMLVAYNRGKMEGIRDTELYDHYAKLAQGYDVIVGCIANDRMFYVLDNFFLGNITDKALVMSLSALELGEQYVAVTEKACRTVEVREELELSELERLCLRNMSESNRIRGVNLANDICRDYRREGMFFDEILEKAANV
jgi:transcriptional regulator with XRE-family HTH domain